MKAYSYNSTGAYSGETECSIDPLETKAQGKNVYLLPANAVTIAPQEYDANTQSPVWNGNAWCLVSLPTPDLETQRAAKLDELSAAAQATIIAGCDVILSDGTTGHISLTTEDQINLTTAQATVQGGATGYPYHLDGELCKIYAAADILIMGKAAVAHILYHTTYCNHLRAWAQRATTSDEMAGITYGATLPDDLKANMEAIISAASA